MPHVSQIVCFAKSRWPKSKYSCWREAFFVVVVVSSRVVLLLQLTVLLLLLIRITPLLSVNVVVLVSWLFCSFDGGVKISKVRRHHGGVGGLWIAAAENSEGGVSGTLLLLTPTTVEKNECMSVCCCPHDDCGDCAFLLVPDKEGGVLIVKLRERLILKGSKEIRLDDCGVALQQGLNRERRWQFSLVAAARNEELYVEDGAAQGLVVCANGRI